MKVGIILVIVMVVTVISGRRPDQDYVADAKLGRGYRLVYEAKTWELARNKCMDEGAKLAIPKSEDEFNLIQRLVRQMHYPSINGWTGSQMVAWIGVSNLEDYNIWKNVDGENINDTGYSTWAQHNDGSYKDPKDPHCVVVDPANPGLRVFWCHLKQPFVCETRL